MVHTLVILYLCLVNAFGLFLMAWDKRQAMRDGWRIAEKSLLGTAVLGGSLGVYAGMRLCRHKTLRPQFRYGVPAIIALQCAALAHSRF